ncbi:hypothetical protein ACGCUQ_08205 [Eubacteriales bacterium KG127]
MFRSFLVLSKYETLDFLNKIIFGLSKFPIIKNAISYKSYKGAEAISSLIQAFSIFFGIVKTFAKKFIYYIFLTKILIAVVIKFMGISSGEASVGLLVFLNLIVTIMGLTSYLDNDLKKFFTVKILGLPAKHFIFYDNYVSSIMDSITMGLVFGGIFHYGGMGVLGIFSLMLTLFTLRLILMQFFVFISKPGRETRRFKTVIISLFLLLILVLSYVALYFSHNFWVFTSIAKVFEMPIFAPAAIVTFILSCGAFLKDKTIGRKVYSNLKYSVFKDAEDTLENINSQNLGVDDIDAVESGQFESYKGIEYANKILFSRMGKKIWKKVFYRTVLIAVILVIYFVLMYVVKIISIPSQQAVEKGFMTYGSVIAMVSGYMLYLGEYFVKFTFYNMDLYLIKFNFYRRPEIMGQTIMFRIKKSLQYNSPNLILFMAIIGFIYFTVGGRNIMPVAITMGGAALSMVFFTLHYQILYYLFQPYNEQFQSKGIVFNTINTLIAIIIYQIPRLAADVPFIAIEIFMAFTVAYLIIGVYLVKKLAFKRFKLK